MDVLVLSPDAPSTSDVPAGWRRWEWPGMTELLPETSDDDDGDDDTWDAGPPPKVPSRPRLSLDTAPELYDVAHSLTTLLRFANGGRSTTSMLLLRKRGCALDLPGVTPKSMVCAKQIARALQDVFGGTNPILYWLPAPQNAWFAKIISGKGWALRQVDLVRACLKQLAPLETTVYYAENMHPDMARYTPLVMEKWGGVHIPLHCRW